MPVCDAIDQYLSRYAEPEVAGLPCMNEQGYHHVVVIPAYDETADLLSLLNNITHLSSSVLVILIINAPDQPDNQQALERTKALNTLIEQTYCLLAEQKIGSTITRYAMPKGQELLVVDRVSDGLRLPPKEGVGLARKIGADIACALIHNAMVKSRWIHSTDADVVLPTDYFDIDVPNPAAAVVYPFRHHVSDQSIIEPLWLYELSLHYYVLGLRWARSPYAYHTIGSCLAINYRHYAHVRGFPKRAGAEDFYVLNKLRKVADVVSLEDSVIAIAGRESSRVPFGTGPAITKLKSLENAYNAYAYYQPVLFVYVKYWLSLFDACYAMQDSFSLKKVLSEHTLPTNLNSQHLEYCLQYLGAEHATQLAIKRSSDVSTFRRHMHTWFDAFKTLKMMHFLRDSYYPSISLAQLRGDGEFLWASDNNDHVTSQCRRLFASLHEKVI